jgi:hypothetical protein
MASVARAVRPLAGVADPGAQRKQRGMRVRTDFFDWLGGYPFEVSTVDAVVAFYRERGQAQRVASCGRRQGCNEFVFVRRQES